jgi:hypothetical protein
MARILHNPRCRSGKYVEGLAKKLIALRECEIPAQSISGDDTERALDQLNSLLAQYLTPADLSSSSERFSG